MFCTGAKHTSVFPKFSTCCHSCGTLILIGTLDTSSPKARCRSRSTWLMIWPLGTSLPRARPRDTWLIGALASSLPRARCQSRDTWFYNTPKACFHRQYAGSRITTTMCRVSLREDSRHKRQQSRGHRRSNQRRTS